MAHIFRFPRPKSFLHLISLRTATEFITFTLAINKVTGLYGILALFTGYHLNPLQLSHYIYSLLVLALILYLSPALRQKDGDGALKTVALAWVYVLDSVINSVYTALFGAGWFIILAQHLQEGGEPGKGVPGGSTMNDTAGFTKPQHTVSSVEIVATPAAGAVPGQEAVAYASAGSLASNDGVILQPGSIASITVISLLWLIKIYFCIIVLSFARSTLRQYIASASSASYQQSDDATMAENPFQANSGLGAGWRGKLGRFMLKFPTQRYWLGRDESEEWVRATSGRFEAGRNSRLRIKVPPPAENGVGERERRARSGTGPPLPMAVGGAKSKAQQ